jgi:hypothetical protein
MPWKRPLFDWDDCRLHCSAVRCWYEKHRAAIAYLIFTGFFIFALMFTSVQSRSARIDACERGNDIRMQTNENTLILQKLSTQFKLKANFQTSKTVDCKTDVEPQNITDRFVEFIGLY